MPFMNTISNRLLLLCSLLLLPVFVQATELTWYKVEVVVFKHESERYQNSEWWDGDYTLPAISSSVEIGKTPEHRDKAYRIAPDYHLNLKESVDRLRQTEGLEVVLHTGWIQPGLSKNEAKAVHIYEGMKRHAYPSQSREIPLANNDAPRLDGTLRLILARYLHLESDLIWRDTASDEEKPVLFHLKESRRMRSKDIHYLDHPRFGLVVRVTPLEA